VNALQISPELRQSLVTELIKNDIFLIRQKRSNSFLIELIKIESVGLKHAICALISVVACTIGGVDYLTEFGSQVVKEVVETIKQKNDDCIDGSVTQRFCLAILQKMSCKEEVTFQLFESNFI
jgi:hypothetical protein